MKRWKLSEIDKIEIAISAPAVAVLAAGYAVGGEKGMFAAAVALMLLIMAVPLYFLADHVLPAKSGKAIPPPSNGEESVEITIECSKYIVGRRPLMVCLDGILLAKVHRGNIVVVDVPKGMHNLSVHCNKTDEIVRSVELHEGLSLFLWTEPFAKEAEPSIHLTEGGCTPGDAERSQKAYRTSSRIFFIFIFLTEGFMGLTVVVILWKVFGGL